RRRRRIWPHRLGDGEDSQRADERGGQRATQGQPPTGNARNQATERHAQEGADDDDAPGRDPDLLHADFLHAAPAIVAAGGGEQGGSAPATGSTSSSTPISRSRESFADPLL